MEPPPCSDREGAVLDTGQRGAPDGAAAPEGAASAAADKLTGGCNQDGSKNASEATEEASGAASAQAAERTHTDVMESSPLAVSPQEKTGDECAGTEGAVNIERGSVECPKENEELTEVCENKTVTPKIVIEHESAESKESDNSNDDDMDPLITVDDTESQSSDLINFDTVSYDVMCQHGGDDDDDEKSITTLSSLSCDIKVDSPSRHSQASNSSGLSNLLDSSIKETLGLAVNTSALLADSTGSAASSCPSSPSLLSSKTVSSAVDESISEAFMNLLQISEAGEARIVNCDNNVLSKMDSEDICRGEGEESASADRSASPHTLDVFKGPNSVEETIDNLVSDSHSAQEMSCSAVENMSVIETSHPIAESNVSCPPNESNIVMHKDDGHHNIPKSLNVPDISVLKSSDDDKDTHEEVAVHSSSTKKEPESAAHLLSNEKSNLNLHEEENYVNCLTNAGMQDSNDNLVGICEGVDTISSVSHQDIPAKVTGISQNISSTSNGVTRPTGTLKNVDIIAATMSSQTEDDIHFSTGSHDEALVSSTSNEDQSGSAPVVSSTLGIVANETEEHVPSHMSNINENISPEEIISSSTASFVSGEDMSVDTSEKIMTNFMDSQNMEDISNSSQVARSPSPADSALSMSNCVTSEESIQRMSCDSSNETMELMSLEATNGDLSSISDGLSVPAGNINDGSQVNGDDTQFPAVMPDSNAKILEPIECLNSGKVIELSLCEGALTEEVINNVQECGDVNFSAGPSLDKDYQENMDYSNIHAKTDFPNEIVDGVNKRPTTLPEINPNKPPPEMSSGMNFSEFLNLFNISKAEGASKPKQYDVAALDEAQQMASLLVDDIIQMAMIKAEEKLTSSESLTGDRVEAAQVAQILVDGVLSEAHASLVDVGKAEISTTCDIKDSGSRYSMSSSATLDLHSQVTDNILGTEPCLVSCPESIVNIIEELPDSQKIMLNISEDISETKTEPSQEQSQDIPDEDLPCVAEMTPKVNSDTTSDNVNISEDSSLSDSLVDGQSKDSVRTSSTENAGADLSRSSLLTTSDLGLRSEASLFVDGVLQEAVKKYEESSSSETSPVKIRSLALDPEFFQEEEELATPCGEMLTEHFMDFESGRNVSVFCSIPENRNEDHLLAYDRVAHTIGNREVDSDTGKSLSVFRIEEDVFYEIQRASTSTSVFESVEEEDEDMIDTTIPVEERPETTLSTSASFPSYDKEILGTSDDPFSADCDAFEDAVGAFLTKERLAHNELRNRAKSDFHGAAEEQSEVTCRALVLRHPEIDISNSDEKKRMAEKWANGGESEVPDTPEMREKQRAIKEALDSDDDVAVKLCRLALTEGGLINDALRREAWPRMLGLDPTLEVNAPSLEDLKSHPEYEQVVLDVNRSLKRFPPDIPKDQRETLQDKLTRLIMYVISKHPHLRYYQGYHDVAVTFLLVVGESIAFQIMERLSTEHLSDCMQPTMERTSYLLHFIYPLLHRLHPTLADYLERSEVGTMFCLPWFLTWFGHSLDHYKDVVRLYDHFLASPPLAPLYVAAVLVAHRADEVLAVDCDMAAIHALLSHIPDSLPLEILLHDATELYMKFPPESIEREVEERFRNEQETEARERVRALRRRHQHRHASGSWQLAEIQDRIGGSMMGLNRWMPPWVVQQQRLSMRLLFASATFFVGFYVYSRGGDMLPYP